MNRNIFILFFSLFFLGCSSKVQDEYDSLISSITNFNSDEINKIIDFEIQYEKHFESKLFLGEYYLSIGDTKNAENYLRRAEKIQKYSNKKTKKENISKLYAYLSRISFLNKEYEKTIEYGKKSLKYDKFDNYSIGFLIGHSYVALENNEEAIKIFDTEYTKNQNKVTSKDLQAYMYLLNGVDRIDECKKIIYQFAKTGDWFYGAGTFCSGVFEKANDIPESLLFAFLDYEYYSSLSEPNDKKFIENLQNVESSLREKNQYEIAEPVFKLILGLYKDVGTIPAINISNFITDYLIIRHKINNKNVSQADFNGLLALEPYFSSFPIYYWSVWQCVKYLDKSSLKGFLPVLRKIIALNPSSYYAELARKEINDVFGINITNVSDIDYLLF